MSSFIQYLFIKSSIASAQVFGPVPAINPGQRDIRQTTIDIINKVLTFMALAAVALIVVAGIIMIFSQGGDEQKEKGKKFFVYLILGLILILFAQGIVDFITQVATEAS